MKAVEDPLDVVRESRVRLSREFGNDPKKLIAAYRAMEHKYIHKTAGKGNLHARVAENGPEYGAGLCNR